MKYYTNNTINKHFSTKTEKNQTYNKLNYKKL